MSDKEAILGKLSDLVDELEKLKDQIEEIRESVDDELRTLTDAAGEITNDLEGDEDDNPYDAATDAENAVWSEGWQACIDRIRQDY